MTKLWAAWKVALLWLGVALVAMFGGGFLAGWSEELGRKYGAVLIIAPGVAYVLQKMRLDHASRPGARRDQQPPTA